MMDSISTAASPPGDAPPMPEDAPPAPPAEAQSSDAPPVVSDPASGVPEAPPAPVPVAAPAPMPVLDAKVIAVPETCQLTDNMGMKYTAYRIEVRPPPVQQNGDDASAQQSHSQPPQTAVLRRYRDFAWLHTALSKERPGCVVPPVPEKNAVARFDSEFVEDRRSHLEQFLRRTTIKKMRKKKNKKTNKKHLRLKIPFALDSLQKPRKGVFHQDSPMSLFLHQAN